MRLPFQKRWLLVPLLVIAILSLLVGWSMMRTVPSGYKGIKTQWGQIKGVTGEGLHFVNPFMGENVETISLQIQAFESDLQSTGTTDMQEVTTSVTVNYRLDEGFVEEIYRDFRDQYESRVIRPHIKDALKATTAHFTSTEMIQSRDAVSNALSTTLQESLDQFHIIVVSVSMTDFQFSTKFSQQLEDTATAEKKVLEEQMNLEIVTLQQQQKVITALADYDVTVTNAEAEAVAMITLAEGNAEAINLLAEQLDVSEDYLTYLAILAWDGDLPTYWASDNPIPFLDVNQTP